MKTYTVLYASRMSKIMKDIKKIEEHLENIKRKKQLAIEMEEQFALIDKERKYEYYASLDPKLASMYDEYKKL